LEAFLLYDEGSEDGSQHHHRSTSVGSDKYVDEVRRHHFRNWMEPPLRSVMERVNAIIPPLDESKDWLTSHREFAYYHPRSDMFQFPASGRGLPRFSTR
jgi:hypothetical protein